MGSDVPMDLRTSPMDGASLILDLARTSGRFDPASGEPVWQMLSDLLEGWNQHVLGGPQAVPMTISLMASSYLTDDLMSLLDNPRCASKRDHEYLPPHKVRELDPRCLNWLARQPGRTAAEKIGLHRKALGVVRPSTYNLLENRVLIRVMRDLEQQAAREAERAMPIQGRHGTNKDRGSALRKLSRTCRSGLDDVRLYTIAPSPDPKPNNVLLSDLHYSKVWRVWNWLKEAKRQPDGAALVGTWSPMAVVLTLLSSLQKRADVYIPTRLVRLAGLFPRPNLLEAEDDGPLARGFISSVDLEPLQVDITSESTGEVSIRTERVPAKGMTPGAPPQDFKLYCDASQVDAQDLRLVLVGHGRTDRISAACTLPGLSELAGQLGGLLGVPPTGPSNLLLSPAHPEIPHDATWTGMACAFNPPFLDLASFPEQVSGRKHLGLASVHRLPGGRRYWLSGVDAAWRFAEGHSGAHTLADLLPPAEVGQSKGMEEEKEALTKLLGDAIRRNGTLRPGAMLAMVLGERTTEAGIARIRSSIPVPVAFRWLWRSVAAALAWRAGTGFPSVGMEPGDGLLVLDGDGTGCELAFLIAGEAPGLEGRSLMERWQWERIRLKAPHSESRGLRAGLLERARHELKSDGDVVKGWVDGGWQAAFDGGGYRAALLPIKDRFHPMVIRPGSQEASEAEWDGKEWFREFLSSPALRELVERCRGRIHVLLSGECMSSPRVQGAVDILMREFGLGSGPHVAPPNCFSMGGLEFLKRVGAGLPTWCERIPELYLKTAGGVAKKIFDGEMVQPGQVLRADVGQIEIQAGCDGIQFDLFRKFKDEKEEMAGRLLLFDPRLHSQTPYVVGLRVGFKFAEEAFALTLHGRGAMGFGVLEATWGAESEVVLGSKVVHNQPPEIGQQDDWNSISSEDLEAFLVAADKAHQCFHDMNKELILQDLRAVMRGDQGRIEQPRDLATEFLGSIGNLEKKIQRLWTSHRIPRSDQSEVLSALDENVFGLGRGLLPEVFKDKGKSRRLNQIWEKSAQTNTSLASQLKEIRKNFILCLARLKADAPPELAVFIQHSLELDKPALSLSICCHVLGRIADGLGSLETILKHLNKALDDGRSREAQHPLWALTTSLFTHLGLVQVLPREVAKSILDSANEVLLRLDEGGLWAGEANRSELYRETWPVVMALLRLRPTGLIPELDASRKEALDLADLLDRVESRLPEKGHKRPRLKLTDGTLQDALRGARIAKIVSLED